VAAIDEASLRFGVPVVWIEAVIAVESGGEPQRRLDQGRHGFDAAHAGDLASADALISGLALIPLIAATTSWPGRRICASSMIALAARGFLAAYNAGPTRYQAYLAGAKRLPPETIAYVARIEAQLADRGAAPSMSMRARPGDWRAAGLFVERAGADRQHPRRATAMTFLDGADQERRP
jgi:hypothetical protein